MYSVKVNTINVVINSYGQRHTYIQSCLGLHSLGVGSRMCVEFILTHCRVLNSPLQHAIGFTLPGKAHWCGCLKRLEVRLRSGGMQNTLYTKHLFSKQNFNCLYVYSNVENGWTICWNVLIIFESQTIKKFITAIVKITNYSKNNGSI